MNDSAPQGDDIQDFSPGSPLPSLVELATLQQLQDRLSALGRLTVCICTVDGRPITNPTWGSRLSELLGKSSVGRRAWREAMRECAEVGEATRPRACLAGMDLFTTAIVADDQRLGVLVVGTRRYPKPTPEDLANIVEEYGVDPEELRNAASLLDPSRGGRPETVRRTADMLSGVIATLYEQAARIARQLRDLRTVHDLSGLLAGTHDLQSILDLTVQRVVEAMEVKACAIRLLDLESGELVLKAVHNLSDEYLNKGPVLLRENVIDATAFAGHSVRIEDVANDSRIRYPENARREGIVSGLCTPLSFRGQTIGVIRVYTAKRHVFTDSEESLLRSIGSQAASAVIHARLYETRVETERMRRQVETAGHIQRRMLPAVPASHAGLEFGCVYDPALHLGGDFYDFITLPDGDLGVCIADVVGKGMPAALLMASIRSSLRAYAPTSDDITKIMRQVNRHMCEHTLASEFATLVYGVLSCDGQSFTCCNAGHPSPLLLRRGKVTELRAGGLAIGIQSGEAYECEVIQLQPEDTIVMVTDGVTEAMDFEDKSYGRDRLLSSIARHRRLDASQLAQQILWDVRRFTGLAEQSDDTTIVVVKVP